MAPLVSAIIPAFNRESTIARSVRSVLAQSYSNIEVIVVDDGSSDGTIDALGEFGSQVTVYRQANSGPAQARNLGASMARGEILAFLDSDDEWLPTKIERQVHMLVACGPAMPCCICNASYSDERGPPPRNSFGLAGLVCPFDGAIWVNPYEVLATTFLLFNQVAAIQRRAFELVGGFNRNLRLMEDFELSLRLATLGDWGVIREPLVIKHEDIAGIGVTAMSDDLKHLEAQEAVFQCILANPQLQRPSIRKSIAAALNRARFQRRVHRWMQVAPNPFAPVGHAILFADRVLKSVARRMPSAPRARMRPL